MIIFIILFICMLFCHIVDDYYLQGWLANWKQKVWWEKNAPNEKYKNDYKVALTCHAFSWSFMIMLPILIFSLYNSYYNNIYYIIYYILFIIINTYIHAYVDNLKANKLKINLIQDQLCHFVQIVVTFISFLITYYLFIV